MAGMFDDLIPQDGGMFDDLIPDKKTLESAPITDAALNAGAAVNSGLQGFANVFGADNGAARFFGNNADTLSSQLSPASKERAAREAAELEVTEDFGDKMLVSARQAITSPLQTSAKTVGYLAPTIATAGAGAAAGLGRAGLTLLNVVTGATQGAGAVKGQIYDTVKGANDADLMVDPFYAELRRSMDEEAAKEILAAKQQSYADNPGKIALGGGVGALTSLTGADAALAKTMAKDQIAKELAKGAMLRTIPKVAATEALTEVPQEILEAVLGNTGASSGGANIDPLQGAAEAGGQALVMGPMGGALGGGMQVSSNRAQLKGMKQEMAALDAKAILDAEASAAAPLALPAPKIIVNERGEAMREGDGKVFDEAPAAVAGRAESPVRQAVREELKALGYEPTQRATPTPIVVDQSGQAVTDEQTAVRDNTVEPPARVVGRQPVEVNERVAEEVRALGYDPTQRATATPITVDQDGNAALAGDDRTPTQAGEQALDERAKKLYPKNEKAREDWKAAERTRELGYAERVQRLAEESNERKRKRGVPIQAQRDPITRDAEPTSELGIVSSKLADGSTEYLFAAQPEVRLVVKPDGKVDARTIVSISDQAQPALLRAALADGPLAAGPKTVSRGVLQKIGGAVADRFGVTRLVGRDADRAKIQAEANRMAAKAATATATKRFAVGPSLELAQRAIATDPRKAATALKLKDEGEAQAALRGIVGEPAVADDQDVLTPMAEYDNDKRAVYREQGIPDDPDFIDYVTDAARDAVKAGHLTKEEFFEATKAAREGRRDDAVAALSKSDSRRGVNEGGEGATSTDPDATVNLEPVGDFDKQFGEPDEMEVTGRQANGYGWLGSHERAVMSAALRDLIDMGVPRAWIDGVTRFWAYSGERRGAATYWMKNVRERMVATISFYDGAMDSEIPGPRASEDEHRKFRGRLLHELAHHADRISETLNFKSQSNPLFATSAKSGMLAYEGAAAKELLQVVMTSTDTALGRMLRYPVIHHLKGDMPAESLPFELFAQSVRAYFTNRAELRSLAPQTYGAVDEFINTNAASATAGAGVAQQVQGEVRPEPDRGPRPDASQSVDDAGTAGDPDGRSAAPPEGADGLPGRRGEVTNEKRSQPNGDGAGRPAAGSLAPLEGAPTVAGATGPDPRLVAVAEQYARDNGVQYRRQGKYVVIDEARAKRLAAAYDEMQHAPQEPRVRAAYQEMIRQATAQYRALEKAGYKFWLFDETNDPYSGNPWNAMRDLRGNQRMGVFASEAGFGSGASDLNVDDNPLLADTGIKWPYGSLDGEPKRVLANDLFRAVHDALGHGLEGAGFRAQGEENAWQAHARLFTGDALGALTSETRGQNSWLNFGSYGEQNRNAKVEDTIFADQKTGLMPEWTWREGFDGSPSSVSVDPTKAAIKTTNSGALSGVRVYHAGTYSGGGPLNIGPYKPFWVSEDKDFVERGFKRGGTVTEFSMSVKKPAFLEEMVSELLPIYNADKEMLAENPDAEWTDEDGDIAQTSYLLTNSGDVLDHLRKLGYDSVKVEEMPGVFSYGLLDAEQLEIGSNPIADPDIRRSSKSRGDTTRMRMVGELEMFEQLSPKRRELTMNWVIENPFDARRVLKLPSYRDKPSITKRDLGEAIDRFRTEKIDPKDFSPKAVERLAKALADEVQWYAKNAKDPGIDWYTSKFQRAIDALSRDVPSLKQRENRGLFTAILAITSDGTDVQANLNYTMDMYQGFMDGRDLTETVPQAGQQAASYRKHAEYLQQMVDALGVGEAVDFLLEPMYVADVKAEMRLVGEKSPASDYPDDAKLPRAAIYLGPKLGAFYANLMGERGYLTMDRWWNRTVNRYRGVMAASATEQSIDTFRELVGNEHLSDEEVVLQAQLISADRQRKYEAERAKGGRYNASKLETLATTIDKNARTELRDSPQGPQDRRFQIGVVQRAKALLADAGIEASVADIQATIWYYEKDLFEKIGVKGKGRISYEEAARNWRDRHSRSDTPNDDADAAGEGATDADARPEQGALFTQDRGARRAAEEGVGGERVDALADSLGRDLSRPIDIRGKVPPAGSAADKLARAAKRIFGKQLVFYTSDDPGVPAGGAFLPASPETIYLNAQSSDPVFVLGHELLHDLKVKHADIYASLVLTMRKFAADPLANRDRQEASYGRVVPDALLEEENLADLSGFAFKDEKFWESLGESLDAPKTRTFFQWLADWTDKLLAKITKRDISDDAQMAAAASDMRDAFAKAYAESIRRDDKIGSVKADAEFGVMRSHGRSRASDSPVNSWDKPERTIVGRAIDGAMVAASKVASPVTATAQAINKGVDRVGQELARVTGVKKLGEKVVGLVDKAIESKASWTWVERVKQGLVSDYGLPEEYLQAKIEKQSRENKLLREAKGTLDRLSSMTPDQLAVAYQWLQEKPDTRRERELLGRLSPNQQAAMQKMKTDIDNLSKEAVKLGLITEETYERNKFAYVHRSYKKYEAELSGGQVVARQRATRLKGDQFKGRGMQMEVSLDRVRGKLPIELKGAKVEMFERRDASGKLVRRDFAVQGAKAPEGYSSAGTWEITDATRKGDVKIWRDFTLEERQRMGEIEDARYGFARTMLQGVRDVETARFLGWMGRKYSKAKADGLDVVEIKPLAQLLGNQTFTQDEWVKVPESKIGGTNVTRYGALAGKHIPAIMWNDLAGAMESRDGMWEKMLSAWKISKTALSPAVHVNNVMSNFIMADLAEVGVNDIRKALETILRAKGGDAIAKGIIERYEDSGAESGSFAANEIRTGAIEPLLKQISESEPDVVQRASLANVVSLLAHGQIKEGAVAATKTLPGRALGSTIDGMIKAYQAEDAVFRLAKFINEINGGKTDQQAGKAAREAFLNYDINAPWVRAARRTALPFISFTYRAVPLILKAAATKPWKFAKYAAVGQALSMLAYAMLGDAGDEDKEKRLLPDELQGTMLGLPKMMRMPWNDGDNDPLWLDVRRWLPAGDMAELNNTKSALPLPQWLSIGGPLSLLIDFYSNTDYRGNKVVQESDTAGETIMKVTDMVMKFALPNLPVPGAGWMLRQVGVPVDTGALDPYGWAAMERGMSGAKTKTGKDVSAGLATASALGVKLRPRRISEELINLDARLKAQEREIKTDISRIANLGARGEISAEESKRRIDREVEKLKELGKRTAEKLGGK